MKICSKCKLPKEVDFFAKDKRYSDGRYPSCKDCKSKLQKLYYQDNKEEVIKRDVARKVAKYRTNDLFALKHKLRSRLRTALREDFSSGLAIDLLGCTLSEFKKYLESKFKPGMTWENNAVNGWHIDHIKSLASFDLTKEDELKKACHYTNLQPLWAEENWQKH